MHKCLVIADSIRRAGNIRNTDFPHNRSVASFPELYLESVPHCDFAMTNRCSEHQNTEKTAASRHSGAGPPGTPADRNRSELGSRGENCSGLSAADRHPGSSGGSRRQSSGNADRGTKATMLTAPSDPISLLPQDVGSLQLTAPPEQRQLNWWIAALMSAIAATPDGKASEKCTNPWSSPA